MNILRSLTITSVSALALLAPGPAIADTYTAPDASGDVVKFVDTDSSGEAAPGRTDGDIVSSTLTHGRRSVTATLQHQTLPAVGDAHELYAVFHLATSRMHRFAMVEAHSGAPDGKLTLMKPSGSKVKCRGTGFAIDLAAGTITVKVPRSCLGYPKWVRMGAWSVTTDNPGADVAWPSFEDDALTSDPSTVEDMTLGPRVYR